LLQLKTFSLQHTKAQDLLTFSKIN